MLGGSRLHSTAGNRAEEVCALEHGSHNRTGDTGADLKAERTAAEDQAFLTQMALPLTVFYNVAHHAEYQRGQRSLTERADDGHYQNPPEAHRVYHNECMGDNNYDTAGERQVALVEFLQQYWTHQRANDQCDDLGGVNDAVIPFIVAENIFAVIRQIGADDGGMYAGDGPQNERCPEIRVAQQGFQRTGSGNLGLLLLRGLEIDGFLAANKADTSRASAMAHQMLMVLIQAA